MGIIEDIFIKITKQPLSLYLESDCSYAGSQYDNKAKRFVFTRPKEYAEDNLLLMFGNEQQVFPAISIGSSNYFIIPNTLTQTTSLNLQIAFEHDGDILTHSSIRFFSLYRSLYEATLPVEPWPGLAVKGLSSKAFCTAAYGDGMLSFYNMDGAILEQFDISEDIQVGLVQTAALPPDENAQVEIRPDGRSLDFCFYLPKAAKGDKGDPGAKGDKGDPGEKGEQGPPGNSVDLNVHNSDPAAHSAAIMNKANYISANLWHPNKTKFPIVSDGVTITYDHQTEIYTVNGTATASRQQAILDYFPSFLKEGQNYVISRYYIGGAIAKSSGSVFTSYIHSVNANSNTVFTIESKSIATNYQKNLSVAYAPTEGQIAETAQSRYLLGYFADTVFDNYQFRVQFEEGTQTPWHSYLSLCELSQVTDGKMDRKNVAPTSDNTQDNGSAQLRWRDLYVASGSINSSDLRVKKDIESLSGDEMLSLISKLNPVRYRYTDGTSGRPHYGLIAQEVERAVLDCGLTDFAGLIKSPVYSLQEAEEIYEDIQPRKKQIIDYIYGLRYNEFIAMLIKVCQMHETRIHSLETSYSK